MSLTRLRSSFSPSQKMFESDVIAISPAFSRPSKLTAQRTGMQQARKTMSCIMRSAPSPLVYAPRLACM